jgi:hypothetical protein
MSRLSQIVAIARGLTLRTAWPNQKVFDDFGRRLNVLMDRMGYRG